MDDNVSGSTDWVPKLEMKQKKTFDFNLKPQPHLIAGSKNKKLNTVYTDLIKNYSIKPNKKLYDVVVSLESALHTLCEIEEEKAL